MAAVSENLILQFKKQDRNTKEFIYRYLNLRYRPRVDEERNELWTQDGRNYATLESGSLRLTNRMYV